MFCFVFFFSSRRRHTRSLCDWSSDVCSSDLPCYNRARFNAAVGSSQSCRIEASKRLDRANMNINMSIKRSEEHTSELQSHSDLVCRLLLEKKKKKKKKRKTIKKKK